MRYHVLATDYDGTLATHGKVDPSTLEALERLRASGRKLVMVTGRQLEELLDVFPQVGLFDCLVVENGALLYNPKTGKEKPLGDPPPGPLIAEIKRRGVDPLNIGRVIINTWEPHHTTILETIRSLGLEYQVIFNKGAVMVLPSGLNKAVGLAEALKEMGLSVHNVVGVGDAENDHAFLRTCEVAAAVANALPVVKDSSDLVMKEKGSAGVAELINELLKNDLASLDAQLIQRRLEVGKTRSGESLFISPYGENVLVSGTPISGKSTFAISFLEELEEKGYQYCIVDPEGDYQTMENAVMLGGPEQVPVISEVGDFLRKSQSSCVISMLAIEDSMRRDFFEALWPKLLELRREYGRPHWIILDEAHQLLPAENGKPENTTPEDIYSMMFITAFPGGLARFAVTSMDYVFAFGKAPRDTMRIFSQGTGIPHPPIPELTLKKGEGVAWKPKTQEPPAIFSTIPPRTEHRRHQHKYAIGEILPERSFYFRESNDGERKKASNLREFIEVGEGIDNGAWMEQLQKGDFSNWFQGVIQDEQLAEQTRRLEQEKNIAAEEAKQRLHEIIRERYPESSNGEEPKG